MPTYSLSLEENAPVPLSEVPEYEVWEDTDGNLLWRTEGAAVLYVSPYEDCIELYSYQPDQVMVVRRISDPIRIVR